jgi:hypothetical protein
MPYRSDEFVEVKLICMVMVAIAAIAGIWWVIANKPEILMQAAWAIGLVATASEFLIMYVND